MNVTMKLTRIADTANSTDGVRRMMTGWNRTIAVVLDGEVYEFEIRDGQATLHTDNLGQATLSFTLAERTLDELLADRITPLAAKLQGKIKSEGNIIDILRFASILSASVKHLQVSVD
jgi:hypothetical protein